jgi:hypothetical protein
VEGFSLLEIPRLGSRLRLLVTKALELDIKDQGPLQQDLIRTEEEDLDPEVLTKNPQALKSLDTRLEVVTEELLVRVKFNKDQLIPAEFRLVEVTEEGKDQARVQLTDIRKLEEVNRVAQEELMEQAVEDRFITKKDLTMTRAIVDDILDLDLVIIPVLRQFKDRQLRTLRLRAHHLKDLPNASISGLIRTTDGSAKILLL